MIYFTLFSCTDYALHFQSKGESDYANIWGMHSLTQFTVCLWMQSPETAGTLFSYAVPGTDNELLLDYSGDFVLSIDAVTRLVIIIIP